MKPKMLVGGRHCVMYCDSEHLHWTSWLPRIGPKSKSSISERQEQCCFSQDLGKIEIVHSSKVTEKHLVKGLFMAVWAGLKKTSEGLTTQELAMLASHGYP